MNQYDSIGEEYTRQQREFFAGSLDWPREKIRKHLVDIRDKKILDIGCGGGDDMVWCQEQGADVYGIDPSEKMLDLAREKIADTTRVQSGGYTDIPFPDSSFDFVFGRFSLHYLPTFEDAYREVARVMKPGGILLETVNHPTFDVFALEGVTDKSLITLKLFNGKVTIQFPPHTLKDYFSDTFFRLFDLQEIDESESVDAENPRNLPETLFFMAQRR
ncbi:MAG: class I SAM-dependent methyltransferase [Patescibacteria group bacterium]